MGGGPSQEQKNAAQAQANLSNQTAQTAADQTAFMKSQEQKIDPFATSRLNNGLPYFDALTDYTKGTTAQAFAPGRGAILRKFGTMSGLPSGMKEQTLADYDANEARAFDSNMVNNLNTNEAAKQGAAALLTGQEQISNPVGYTSAAMQGNQSIMQAPLQTPGIGGLIGGLAQGVISKLPMF